MKKIFTLIAACLFTAMGEANAEETRTIVYQNDFETSSDWTLTGTGGIALNPGTTTLNTFGSKVVGVGKGSGDTGAMSPQFIFAEGTTLVDVEMLFKMDGCAGGKSSDISFVTAKNTGSWTSQPTVFSINASATDNATWNTITVNGGDIKGKVYQTTAGTFEDKMSGNRGNTGLVKLVVRLNFSTHTATYSLSRTNGTELVTNKVVNFNTNANSFYGIFIHGGKNYGGVFVDDVKVYSVTTTTQKYGINIKYQTEDGEEIPAPQGYETNSEVESGADYTPSYPSVFYIEGYKYTYISGGNKIENINENKNVILTYAKSIRETYNYTVNAVDPSDNVLSELASGTVYADIASISVTRPTYILGSNNVLYTLAGNSSNATITSNNQVINLSYSTTDKTNVVYYSEVENITGTSYIDNGNASNKRIGRTTYEAKPFMIELTPGKYKIYAVAYAGNGTTSDTYNAYFYANDVIVATFGFKGRTNNQSYTSDEIILAENSVIKYECPTGSATGLDYIYIQKTGDLPSTVNVAVNESGTASYVAPYNLDFEGSDLTAYVATACDGSTITLEEVTKVAAGQAVVVKGKTSDVVVITESVTPATNLFTSGAKTVGAADVETVYAISKTYGDFRPVAAGVEIPAGKAYIVLPASTDAAKSLSLDFGGEATGISNAVAAQKMNGAAYNILGQKVSKNAKGLVIINGKKVRK